MEWNIKWSWCELRKYKFWWRDLHWILAWENSRHLVTLPLVSRPSYLNLYFRSSRHFHLRNIFARFLMSVNERFFDTTAYGFVSPHLLSFQWSVRSYQNVAYVQTPPRRRGLLRVFLRRGGSVHRLTKMPSFSVHFMYHIWRSYLKTVPSKAPFEEGLQPCTSVTWCFERYGRWRPWKLWIEGCYSVFWC